MVDGTVGAGSFGTGTGVGTVGTGTGVGTVGVGTVGTGGRTSPSAASVVAPASASARPVRTAADLTLL